MSQIIGKQYRKDKLIDKTGFLEKARLHQSQFRAFNLKVPCEENGYGSYLKKDDAENGLNFYNGFSIFEQVKKRYPKYSKPLYANMLRSEHIAFNLFVPFKADRRFGKNVLNLFLNNQIKSIDKILIEYAPNPSEEYLNDKTSFDAYIEYTHIDEEKGIVGIEVKYTEHEYKLKKGSKEETDLNNRESTYFKITEKSGLYLPGITQELISDKFRQIWRNQLLGESIILKDKSVFKHFTSLMIFPRGNTHFIEASQEYLAMLSNNENRFVPLTYEAFISNCERFCPNEEFKKWISYLTERYIVK